MSIRCPRCQQRSFARSVPNKQTPTTLTRFRECPDGHRFTTIETIIMEPDMDGIEPEPEPDGPQRFTWQ